MTPQHTLYEKFARAWADRDVDTCISLMTTDVTYGASVGPEPGQTFRGHAAVRKGITAMLAHDNATALELVSFVECDSIAFAEWRYTLEDGGLALGIDRIEFRNGKIASKIAYRKAYGGDRD